MYLSDVCTIPTNLTGACADERAGRVDAAGLPIGVQVLAPALGEAVMLRAARPGSGVQLQRPSGTSGGARLMDGRATGRP